MAKETTAESMLEHAAPDTGSEAAPSEDASQVEPQRKKPSWSARILVLMGPGFLIALLFSPITVCPVKNLFGVPCPGCGLTRATFSLLNFDIWGAIQNHALVFVLMPLLAYAVLRSVAVEWGFIPRGQKDLLQRIPRWVYGLLGISMLALWVIRLAGGLGGHPDPIDFDSGWLFRFGAWVKNLVS